MTPRTFFTFVIKILGIYLIFEVLLIIPSGITTILTYKSYFDDDSSAAILGIVYSIAVLVVYLLILSTCIYKTDWIIKTLALDEHFTEEKFEINIHRSDVLRIAIIVIGALIFIDALPVFCQQVFNYVRNEQLRNFSGDSNDSTWIIYYFVQMFTGYFLMSSSRLVVNFIERQRKKSGSLLNQEEQKQTPA